MQPSLVTIVFGIGIRSLLSNILSMQSYGLMVLVLVNRKAVLQGSRVAGVSQQSGSFLVSYVWVPGAKEKPSKDALYICVSCDLCSHLASITSCITDYIIGDLKDVYVCAFYLDIVFVDSFYTG